MDGLHGLHGLHELIPLARVEETLSLPGRRRSTGAQLWCSVCVILGL